MILDKQTNKQKQKTKKVNTELDLDKNIHPHSPIHLLRTNFIKVIITCLQDYELSSGDKAFQRFQRLGVGKEGSVEKNHEVLHTKGKKLIVEMLKMNRVKRGSQKTKETTVPSSIPVTMEAKLSSNRIISAACLLTSLPAIPMATPEMRGGN